MILSVQIYRWTGTLQLVFCKLFSYEIAQLICVHPVLDGRTQIGHRCNWRVDTNRTQIYLTSVTFNVIKNIFLTSPSAVVLRRITWALMLVPIMWDFLMSPTLNMKQSLPSLKHMHAYLLNMRVWDRFLGLESFANTMPAMKHWIMTPVMDWTHMINIASGHSSVVAREP